MRSQEVATPRFLHGLPFSRPFRFWGMSDPFLIGTGARAEPFGAGPNVNGAPFISESGTPSSTLISFKPWRPPGYRRRIRFRALNKMSAGQSSGSSCCNAEM